MTPKLVFTSQRSEVLSMFGLVPSVTRLTRKFISSCPGVHATEVSTGSNSTNNQSGQSTGSGPDGSYKGLRENANKIARTMV
jgi:hypothetical protein